MPQNACLVTGSWGKLPHSGFMVTEGSLRGADRVPRQLQAAPALVGRVLLTTVMCLSNCPGSVLLLAALLLFLLLPAPAAPPRVSAHDDSLVFPGTLHSGGGAERPSPNAPTLLACGA